jgi:nitroimidazol reductase NimA-like FMN-containing flavoprotein (pyridoxamine 5'-phosphate oxidase superfamily)
MIGTLSPVEIETMLRRQRVGRVCCTAGNRPYLAVFDCAYRGLHLYGWAEPAGLIAAMRAQPLVCVEVDEIAADGGWRCIVAEGHYEEVAEPAARRAILEELGLTADGVEPPPGHVLFRIRLLTKSGRFGREEVAG